MVIFKKNEIIITANITNIIILLLVALKQMTTE